MAKKRKPYNKSTGRKYSGPDGDYAKFQSSPSQIKDRSARNKARSELEKEGRVKKGDGKDIDHSDSNPRNNKKSNLKVMSKSKNRGKTKNGKRV